MLVIRGKRIEYICSFSSSEEHGLEAAVEAIERISNEMGDKSLRLYVPEQCKSFMRQVKEQVKGKIKLSIYTD